jgi:hypothetical protein
MARLAADIAAEPGRWPVLGFFGDACLFARGPCCDDRTRDAFRPQQRLIGIRLNFRRSSTF